MHPYITEALAAQHRDDLRDLASRHRIAAAGRSGREPVHPRNGLAATVARWARAPLSRAVNHYRLAILGPPPRP
jgi:hypothetical protein